MITGTIEDNNDMGAKLYYSEEKKDNPVQNSYCLPPAGGSDI